MRVQHTVLIYTLLQKMKEKDHHDLHPIKKVIDASREYGAKLIFSNRRTA